MRELTTPVRYEFHMVGTEDICFEVASSFHEALRGNEDYIENRIVLNQEGGELSLTIFEDSRSHWVVDTVTEGWRHRPKLRRLEGRYDK